MEGWLRSVLVEEAPRGQRVKKAKILLNHTKQNCSLQLLASYAKDNSQCQMPTTFFVTREPSLSNPMSTRC